MLTELEVSSLFCRSHYSINFFIDGISSRRGSAIAALNLGLPIITNFTSRSDKLFLNRKCISIIANTPDEFNTNLQLELKKIESLDMNNYLKIRSEAFDFVDTYLSWDIICEKYILLTKDRGVCK
jgi:hypothetical protein